MASPIVIVRSKVIVAAFILNLFLSYHAIAQEQQSPPVGTLSTAEGRWSELQAARQSAPGVGRYAGRSGDERKALMLAEAGAHQAKADDLRQFYTDFPEAPQAGEARFWEVQNLIWAAQAGERSQDQRWQTLSDEVRRDMSLPSKDRFAVASQADFFAITRDQSLSATERQTALIRAARGLTAEFPTEPGGYESLLGLARSSRDVAVARVLAEEVAGMPAPDTVKHQARQLTERLALVGQNIGPILADVGFPVAIEEGRALIIYSWITQSRSSLALAEQLGKQVGAAQLIGLCLDTDLIAARELAENRKLPGRQLYDGRGRDGALAQALKLNDAGWVYLVDETGTIISVRGQDDPQAWETLLSENIAQ